jgi:thiol-disulfide isomerase/thioredoxin
MSLGGSRRVRAAARVIVVVGVLAACPAGSAAQTAAIPDPPARLAGRPLVVSTLAGDLRVDRLRGKVVLLDFMTTVCPACKRAAAGIEQVYLELRTKGFHPIGVALNEASPETAGQYALALGLTFGLATAPRAAVLEYVQHPADRPFLVPTLVLLDRQGRVCSIEVGWTGEQILRTRVLKLLSEPAGHP